MQRKKKIKQIILLILGLTIAHLGVTLFIQTNLGTDPFNVLIQGIFRTVPWPSSLSWSHGMTHMFICFFIIIILLFIDKSYIKIGTLICMFLGGPIIDVFTFLLGDLILVSFVLSLTFSLFLQGSYWVELLVSERSFVPLW